MPRTAHPWQTSNHNSNRRWETKTNNRDDKGKGFNSRKGSEKFSPESFIWHNGRGQAIAQDAFSSVEHVTIKGASTLDRIQITTMDFAAEDLSLYLPLWAKMLPKSFAKKQIDTWFLPRYLREFGIPLTSPDNILPDSPPSFHALLPWVALIGQGLLNYDYRIQAAEILTRILNTIVIQLKKNLQFGEYYDTETGQALGKTNALSGLAPVGFFLNVAGIQNLGERMVIINGKNPFPWPVTVKYKGMTITRKSEDTEILFPSGEVISVKGPGPHHVSLR